MAATKAGSQRPLQCGVDAGNSITSTLADVPLVKAIVVSGGATSANGRCPLGAIMYNQITVLTSSYGSTVALNVGTTSNAVFFTDVSGVTGSIYMTTSANVAGMNGLGDKQINVAVSGSASPTGKITVFIPYVVV